MAERSLMKRRVRGLFKKNRLKPLCALVLASLPMLLVTAAVLFLMDSPIMGIGSLFSQITALFAGGIQTGVMLLLYGGPLDYSQLVASVPACAVFFAVYLLIGMPVAVSTSGFLLATLRGKETRVMDVFGCFSGRYPRIVGGMLYKQLWVLIWGAAMIVVPLLFGIIGNQLVEAFTVQLNLKMYFFFGAVALSVVLFFILLVFFINRLLAYHLTPVCIAAQPNLPAFRAVRLSRKLMRGQKGSLVALYLSFLSFYVPAILCGAALLLLNSFAAWLSLEEGIVSLTRMGFWGVIGFNMLVTLYVVPYGSLCVRAFYIERKREALLDEELTPDDFASEPARG